MKAKRNVVLSVLAGTILLAVHAPALCQAPAAAQVGIEERLGERIPLEALTFTGENGEPVVLAELFDRPVVLALVYFRCAGICSPLLRETARLADITGPVPGEDYRIVTVSFDPKDTAELARIKKENLLASMKNREVPDEAWRFLVGEPEMIGRITESVGFRYQPDPNGVDFVHAGALLFVSSDGKIVRYLNGTQFNPADIELALVDATEGRARSFMQKMQRLCYNYDPEGRGYVLKINRIILGVTLLFALLFVAYLVTRGVTRRSTRPRIEESVS